MKLKSYHDFDLKITILDFSGFLRSNFGKLLYSLNFFSPGKKMFYYFLDSLKKEYKDDKEGQQKEEKKKGWMVENLPFGASLTGFLDTFFLKMSLWDVV